MSGSEKKAGLGKTFGLVAVLTVASKIIGLARDMVIASCYGTGIVADAYNYAYMLTGNILILFGGLGGPFHSTTVSILGSRKEEESAGALVLQIVLVTFVALLILTCFIYFFAEPITSWMASSYKPTDAALARNSLENLRNLYATQVKEQLIIMLPLIVIAGLIGIAYGVSNVANKVLWPSLSPAIASIAIIIAVLFLSDPQTRLTTGVPLAVGTLAGAVGQLLVQLPSTFNSGVKWSFSMKPAPGLSEYSSMLWPAIFSTSIGQLTVYVDGFFTSQFLHEGAWTAIVNSNRLVQLPLGVLLTAMLVPILPRFTDQAQKQQTDDLKEEFRRALRFLWFLSLPMSAILLAIPSPIIKLLFQRGNFDESSTALVTTALVFLVPSIFFYVGRDLITRVFYAYKDSKTPYHVALVAIVVKAGLDWYLVSQTNLGVGGINLASTFITIMNLGLLAFFLQRKIGGLGFSKLVAPVAVMLSASACAYGGTTGIYQLLGGYPDSGLVPLLVSVAVSSAAGLVIFALLCLVFKLEEPSMLVKRLARKSAPAAGSQKE